MNNLQKNVLEGWKPLEPPVTEYKKLRKEGEYKNKQGYELKIF